LCLSEARGTVGRAQGKLNLLLLGREAEGGLKEEAAESRTAELVGEHHNDYYTGSTQSLIPLMTLFIQSIF
jgi:hypothetical protein